MERGSGRTTGQMRAAARGSLYVMPDRGFIGYAQSLAAYIDRLDLIFTSPDELAGFRGKVLNGVAVDHAANLTPEQERQKLNLLTLNVEAA